MAAVTLQVIPSFYTNYSKNSLFISANTYEKFIVNKEYCIARHDDKMCFLPNCRYHIILIGNIKELLQKLDANTWTVCIHFSTTASLAKSLSRVDKSLIIWRGQFISTSKQRSEENAQHREKDSWGKSTKTNCWAPSKRPSRRKLVDHFFADRIDQVKKLNLN